MKKFWEDFKKFITRGNVIDMAVGVAVASAFTAIVTAFTKGFISPLLALLTNDSDLASMKSVLREEVLDEAGEVVQAEVAILWGTFVQAIIDFLIIALALFIVMRVAAAISSRTKKIREKMEAIAKEEELAAAAAKEAEEKAIAEAKAAEEARVAAEAKAAEEARIEAAAREERERLQRQEDLLTEIRDLLRKN